MFRRADDWIVPQWEHSRLSGDIAGLLCTAMDTPNDRLCGAIALHDWPHFSLGGMFDTIAIREKSDDQQRQLLACLSGPLPLDALSELLVRLHWRRRSQDVWQELNESDRQPRIDTLQDQLGLSPEQSAQLDRWTELCDGLSFHASLGQSSSGTTQLARPLGDQADKTIHWQVTESTVALTGPLREVDCQLSILAFQGTGYPEQLVPRRIPIKLHIASSESISA